MAYYTSKTGFKFPKFDKAESKLTSVWDHYTRPIWNPDTRQLCGRDPISFGKYLPCPLFSLIEGW